MAGEVLVRLVSSGVCHTDLAVRDQLDPVPLPAVLGHEGAGVIEAVGADVTAVRPGDAVVMSFASCSHCRMCDSGRPSYCDSFYDYNFGAHRPDGGTSLRHD